MADIKSRIRFKRGTTTQINSNTDKLLPGAPVFDTQTRELYIGNTDSASDKTIKNSGILVKDAKAAVNVTDKIGGVDIKGTNGIFQNDGKTAKNTTNVTSKIGGIDIKGVNGIFEDDGKKVKNSTHSDFVTVLQTTGNSTTQPMSQNAISTKLEEFETKKLITDFPNTGLIIEGSGWVTCLESVNEGDQLEVVFKYDNYIGSLTTNYGRKSTKHVKRGEITRVEYSGESPDGLFMAFSDTFVFRITDTSGSVYSYTLSMRVNPGNNTQLDTAVYLAVKDSDDNYAYRLPTFTIYKIYKIK